MKLIRLEGPAAVIVAERCRDWVETIRAGGGRFPAGVHAHVAAVEAFAGSLNDNVRQTLVVSVGTADHGEELLDVRQVADLLGCSSRTVQRLRKRGQLRSVKVGALRRYRPADVAEYLARPPGAVPPLPPHKSQCRGCGAPLEPPGPTGGRPRQWCTDLECQRRTARDRHNRIPGLTEQE